jgi:hypothetical protein
VEETDFIWIRPEQDERTRVGLAYEAATFDSYIANLSVRVETDRFEYEGAMVIGANADGLAAFFNDLAEEWRGWAGTRQWDALEHGMSVHATHQGRRVELVFVVRRDYKPDAWELRVPVLIAPGETLMRFASSLARSFPSKLPAEP